MELVSGSSSLSGVVTSEAAASATSTSVSQSQCSDSKKSIDEQLKEFGSRLSNKVRNVLSLYHIAASWLSHWLIEWMFHFLNLFTFWLFT